MKIGDYVRTESGYIDKIEGFSGDAVWFENDTILVHKSRMEEWGDKTSPNLIDLIEIGDYVNGSRVVNIYQKDSVVIEKHENIFEEDGTVWSDCIEVNVNDIKEILTKEQYEREVYRV